MAHYHTPHINADTGDFAETVLMPGDPLRSKFLAENFLSSPKLVNNVRGVQGYTGTYEGVPVSVMASGMGMPSIGIYSYELFNFFGVENIIRIGSAGALQENIKLLDIVIAQGASTDSNYASQFELPGTFAPLADYKILKTCDGIASDMGISYHVGNVLSSDFFYGDSKSANEKWQKMGILAIEMESAALYMNAAKAKKRALGIFTVSDQILTGETTTSEERQTKFPQMMELALKTALKMREQK